MTDASTPIEILQRSEELLATDANEAETRLKIVDRVLFDVLGWTHDDVRVEERATEDKSTKFVDYVCTTAIASLVIEAKRVGGAFDDLPNVRRVLLGRLLNTSAKDAILQARDYARRISVGFAVVTNGLQWIVFPVNRTDKVTFENSSAIVFPSLKSALSDDYVEFTALLSRSAVISSSLYVDLLGRSEDQIESRRLNSIFQRSFSKVSRSSLFPLIESAITAAFTEEFVGSDPDLLERCYVTTPDRQRYDARIRMQLARRKFPIEGSVRRPMRQKEERALVDIINETSQRARPTAIIVIGSVGAGKTTFLNYTRQVSARSIFEAPTKTPLWLYVDFRDREKDQATSNFLSQTLLETIRKNPFLSDYDLCVQHAYKEEIDALFRGPLKLMASDEEERKRQISDLLMRDYKEISPYVEKILKYAAGNVPVFLVIDNVDQFEESSEQEEIFRDVMALSRRLGCNLVIALREATYVKNRTLPVFDAFDFDPVQIDAPLVQAVLSKRFFAARHLLKDKETSFVAENGARMNLKDSSVIIDLLQASVLGTEVGTLLDVMATSDIRLALRMTREFLQYGYTATGKALRLYQSTGKYRLPSHEALRAILLGNRSIYSDDYSVVMNPLDAKLRITSAQQLRLFVSAAVVNFSTSKTFDYISGQDIRRAVVEVGFGEDIALQVLKDLCAGRFLLTVSHGPASFTAGYIPTRLGGYVVRHLLADMMFLENIMMDTFIADQSSWELLRSVVQDVYDERDIVTRVALRRRAVDIFFSYMKNCYDVLHKEANRRGLPQEWCTHPLEHVEDTLRRNFDRALQSAELNYGVSNGNQRRH